MKVVFGSNDAANLSAIQSVCVSDDGKVKTLVNYKADMKGESPCISGRIPIQQKS